MRSLAFALLALAACHASAAQRIVVYRCTDAQGAVMLQNDIPCPKGSRQEKRIVDAPQPPPVVPAAPPVSAPIAPSVAPAPASATAPSTPSASLPTNSDASTGIVTERHPPPPLYRCSTYDRQRYYSETGTPAPRCVPLQTIGLDGNRDTGAGRACEMVTDSCKRVADESLCTAWNLRLRDAQSAAGFDTSASAASQQAELERIGRIVRESGCGA